MHWTHTYSYDFVAHISVTTVATDSYNNILAINYLIGNYTNAHTISYLTFFNVSSYAYNGANISNSVFVQHFRD